MLLLEQFRILRRQPEFTERPRCFERLRLLVFLRGDADRAPDFFGAEVGS